MYAKIQVTGDLVVKTGMHIGGSDAFAAIGAIDSPVIKDIRSNEPMIPGSSLKGKLRTLLAKEYNLNVMANPDDDDERILRLFGCAKKDNVSKSRVLISDMQLTNKADLREVGLQSSTEVKYENTINRATAVANPRQIERVVRGAVFGVDIIYEVEKEDEIIDDFELLAEGMKMLQFDYLGGHGSRGYGKVEFDNIVAECVIGDVDENIIDECNQIFSDKLA